MNKIITAGCMAVVAITAFAMPNKKELAKAQRLVEDVTKADIAAFKAGKKPAKDVAAAHLAFAEKAENEAEKYLLYQGAFKLYARCEEYDLAADMLVAMNRDVSDVPPEVIVEIVSQEMRRVAGKKAPRVLTIFKQAKRTAKYRKEIVTVEAGLKTKPHDTELNRKYGECLAELGRWKEAIPAFAKSAGEVSKIAAGEKDGKLPPQQCADFWWDYGSEADADNLIYKVHACDLYEQALSNNSFDGLTRERAAQRVKDMALSLRDMPHAEGQVVIDGNLVKIAGNDIEITLPEGEKLEFVKIYPGRFPMVIDGKGTVENATITRPYWISKGCITYGQYHAVVGDWIHQGTTNLIAKYGVGRNGLVSHASWCHQKFIAYLQKIIGRINSGYVLRLPSDAEWQYAARGGAKNADDPWVMAAEGRVPGFKRYEIMNQVYGRAEIEKSADDLMKKAANDKNVQRWLFVAYSGAVRKYTNGYGLYGLFMDRELMLDAHQRKNLTSASQLSDWHDNYNVNTWTHFQSMTDPFNYDVGAEVETYRRFSPIVTDNAHKGFGVYSRHGKIFRVVIGPDLVSEWNEKHKTRK